MATRDKDLQKQTGQMEMFEHIARDMLLITTRLSRSSGGCLVFCNYPDISVDRPVLRKSRYYF
jgi:hypothetical protein